METILDRITSDIIFYLPALIIAFTIHEFAHSWVSYKLGDYIVKNDGRVTLNPIKHIDWLGLVLLFVLGFGWAKPVEVHPHLYKNPKKDMALVALAGPLSNFIIAIIGIALNFIFKDHAISLFFFYLWFVNLSIGIFNLIPVPPLDGSKIIGVFMSTKAHDAYLNNPMIGMIFLVIIIATDVMGYILNPIVQFITRLIY